MVGAIVILLAIMLEMDMRMVWHDGRGVHFM